MSRFIHNITVILDSFPQSYYNTKYHPQPSNLMTVSNYYGQKSKYRITLELDVLDDFNPRQIDWRKVLRIEENENLDCYIEEIDCPLDYYNWSE